MTPTTVTDRVRCEVRVLAATALALNDWTAPGAMDDLAEVLDEIARRVADRHFTNPVDEDLDAQIAEAAQDEAGQVLQQIRRTSSGSVG